MSLVFFILITVVLVYFAIKYRRKSEDEETPYITGSEPLEIIWTVIPSILLIVLFVYGYVVFKDMRTPPKDAVEINVQGKQWLWTFDYYNGKKTINELYVQYNRPVRLVMEAQDVLHSFFVPGVPREAGPGTRQIHPALVYSHQNRDIRYFLRRVLRYGSFGDAREGHSAEP